ncbi:hypothetical protein FA13DRAFT_284021 [Coprinellus micaceus]|uniref:WW domain-containing protein n=1 Tax=Coprinellus micaceus TaxID=71717 RepID=A0A4Y7TD38_COPMI|nr:hypothetical protein FA13DRAFT_284021 [Coprinellus micaceus]
MMASDSPTRVLRSDSPPQIPDSFDEPRGRDQPLGQSKQGEQEGYSQRQGTQGSDFYIPPPSPPPVSRGKGSMGGLGMPQPQHPTTQVMPIESHRDEHPTILMPLPPFNSVVAAQPLVQPSTRPQQAGYETDESRPLLGGGANTTKPPIATYGIRPANSTDSAWVPTASSSTRAAGIYSLPRRYGSTTSFRNYDSGHGQPRGGGATLGVVEGYGPNVNPKLHDLGWVEYHLPDGTSYYVHPTLRVTTDVNLRSERLLDDVTDWLDMNPPFGTSGVGAHPGYGATDGSLTGTGTGKAVIPDGGRGRGVVARREECDECDRK